MSSVLWCIYTFGIPLLGVAICGLGSALLFRQVKARHVGRLVAALSYLVATLLPLLLEYLAMGHVRVVFFGEDTWLLLIFMGWYFWFAVVSNVVFLIALFLMRGDRETKATEPD